MIAGIAFQAELWIAAENPKGTSSRRPACANWEFLINWYSCVVAGEVAEWFKAHAWKACVG